MQFVKTDDYNNLKKFAEKDMFYNIFIYGPKGCGKTKTIEKIHEELNKTLIRVNITIETDEDSLIGGFRLRNGETVFDKGPVLLAMEQGATLLLDEIELGHPQRLMCLQSIIEGSPYHIKRTNELIYPKKGFKIWATGNTKGSGDETGQYIGAQILNAAFKDRFSAFFEFNYPNETIETQILQEAVKSVEAEGFESSFKLGDKQIKRLVTWANKIRSTKDMDIDESISTRKLIDIVKGSYVVGDLVTSIENCIRGYPNECIDAFMKIFELIDDDGNITTASDDAKKAKPMFKF